ncbi:MAG: DinB family protein [Acidobacteriota bacterium]
MNHYGAKEIASSFRTVRNNTIKIAEEIPEDKYGTELAPGMRTIGQLLIHISNIQRFGLAINRDEVRSTMEGFNFMAFIGPLLASEKESMTKAQIVQRLRDSGDEFEKWVGGLSDEFLAQVVTMPPGGSPPSRTRFDLLISVKEHEMHHRGQLMVAERMIGITPHLTRAQQERFAAMQAAQAAPAQA